MSDCFDHMADAWDDALFGATAQGEPGGGYYRHFREYAPAQPDIDLGEFEVERETEKARLVSVPAYRLFHKWLPKSQTAIRNGHLYITDWLFPLVMKEVRS